MTVDVPLVGAYILLTACAVLEISRYRRKRKGAQMSEQDMRERLFRWAYNMGIIAGYEITSTPGFKRRITGVHWKGRRSYILGREQDRRQERTT